MALSDTLGFCLRKVVIVPYILLETDVGTEAVQFIIQHRYKMLDKKIHTVATGVRLHIRLGVSSHVKMDAEMSWD